RGNRAVKFRLLEGKNKRIRQRISDDEEQDEKGGKDQNPSKPDLTGGQARLFSKAAFLFPRDLDLSTKA
ncbi:MAG TPA: hypothetical protein VN857_07970, partial [Chthoniobacterales bacterium]|nr:hypothetical protein [Chthoniobacterales bacterium]